jgi:TPR repeat protein
MKAAFLLMAALAVGNVAQADELTDANKLMEAKNYAGAMPLYVRLASAGNPAAQFRLGEIYWYGEGMPADTAKGDEWFRKASAAGYAEAKAALTLTTQRQARQKDIDYYVQGYDGADVALSNAKCVTPDIPARSTNKQEIKGVGDGIDAWMTCYNGFVQKLQELLPAGKAIPADLSNLMTDAEIGRASAQMDRAYSAVIQDARRQADKIVAARTAWQAGTNEYVSTENERTARHKEMRDREILDFATASGSVRDVAPNNIKR